MLAHPKLTMRVLRMLMHLTSSHMTLLLGKLEISFPLISPNRTYGAGCTCIGLCPKFVVIIFILVIYLHCYWLQEWFGTG